jgi:phosphoserine phosphatase
MPILDDPILHQFLASHSNHTGENHVAVFDCDGTIIKGDIGEAMLFHQIEHFHFRVPPAAVWEDHPRRDELNGLYESLARIDPLVRTRHTAFEPFARMILSWYFGQISEGKVEKACSDIVRLFAGFTRAEVQTIAEATFSVEAAAPFSERTLGGHTRPKGIRFIAETVEVLRRLQELNFDIWAVSGSNRWSVEAVFRRVGVESDRVIGIDLVESNGVFLPEVITPVPIRDKKIDALTMRERRIPLLAASDSRNDIPLLAYATELKLFVNSRRKNSSEFFSLSNLQRDSSWVVIERPTIQEVMPDA